MAQFVFPKASLKKRLEIIKTNHVQEMFFNHVGEGTVSAYVMEHQLIIFMLVMIWGVYHQTVAESV